MMNLQEVYGEDEPLHALEQVEIAFSPVPSMAGLDPCKNLKELILIENGLTSISNLAPVAGTLQKLTLMGQNIEKIEGLDGLYQLRELVLTCNKIGKIEGLEGCPNVQVLVLYSNQITRIENLQCVPDLRELWLQDNNISTLENVGHLVNLRALHLAANPVADFKDLECLAKLPALSQISFADEMFGTSPLAEQDGYRNFVVFYLKQVRVLDLVPVQHSDRAAVEDLFLKSVLEFNEKVDHLKREAASNVRQLEQRRTANEQNAELLRKNLVDALLHLEKVVHDGRGKITDEHAAQLQMRKENKSRLKKSLNEIRDEYNAEVTKQIAQHSKRLEFEERFYARLKQRAEAELTEAQVMLNMHSSTNRMYAQELGSKSLDYRFVKSHMQNAAFNQDGEAADAATTSAPEYRLLKVYKLFSAKMEKAFFKQLQEFGGKPDSRDDKMFFAGPVDTVRDFLHGAIVPNLLLFPSPKSALVHNRTKYADVSSVAMVICRVAVGKCGTADNAAASIAPGDNAVLVTDPVRHYKIPSWSQILPEFYIRVELADDSDNFETERALKKHLVDISMHPPRLDFGSDLPEHKRLYALEKKAELEWRKYQENVWEDMSPELARQLEEEMDEAANLQATLDSLQTQLAAERNAQEQLVRTYREALSLPGTSGGKGSPRADRRPPSAKHTRSSSKNH